MLSDGTECAPAPVSWSITVWTVLRCHGECEGLLLWSFVSQVQGLCRVPLRVVERAAYKLSRKLSRAGILSFRPLCLHVLATTWLGWLLLWKGSPGRIYQWTKNVLGEGLTTSVGPQASGEAKGFTHKQVGLYDKHGGASHRGLVKDMAPLPVQDSIDATSHLFQTLDLHKVDRLYDPGLGGQPPSIKLAPGSGDDLATPVVDSVHMQGHIIDIEVHTTHIFLPLSISSARSSGKGFMYSCLHGQLVVLVGELGQSSPDRLSTFNF